MPIITRKMLSNPKLLATLFLGFSSGLPLALVGSTLQAWFTQAHVSLMSIGALSLLGLPYTLKFLWAPLLDYYRIPGFDKRRCWIILTQFILAVILFVFAQMNPESQSYTMAWVALTIAFFSASQDIAIDAYRVDLLNAEERGLGVACTVFGYRIAMLFSGGLALICADYLGWKLTYEIMAVCLLLCTVSAIKAPAAAEVENRASNLFLTIRESLSDLLQRDKIFLILLFIIFYKIGDALALQLMTNFLLHGLGFTLTEIGFAYKILSFIATILGAFVGGAILFHWNIYRGLLVFGLAQAFSNLMFAWLAIAGKVFSLMAASIFIENFCSGLSTAALMAFMMSLCNHRYTASQIALLTAIASLGRVFLGPVAAMLVQYLGWTQFYIISFLLCFPGIIFLIWLRAEVTAYAQAFSN
jgi:MFS transporter, PAT family, beta-lactamase induction signal transducer AmpG